jgi:flavin reductase (DIM6/NTAB) family NADH-FMN oxidoreductase RutF
MSQIFCYGATARYFFKGAAKMAKKPYPLSKVYGLLETGPVLMLSTANKMRSNIMTLSWHTMMEFEPPLVGCIVSNRNDTFDILTASKECVINIPTAALAKIVVGVGNTHGNKIDKFTKFHLTPLPARYVKAPLIAECYANLECKVVDTKLLKKYNFFILEVVQAWIDRASNKNPRTLHHRGHGAFMVAGETIKLPSKMK